MFVNKSSVKVQAQKEDIENKLVEARAKIKLLEEKYNKADCEKLEKQLMEKKLKVHSIKWHKVKQELVATLEEHKTSQTDARLKEFILTSREYASTTDETSSKLKSDIMASKGKQKVLILGNENGELKRKLQEATESRDKMNLKICHMETHHNILQNRNAAMLIRLRKNLHEVECKRRDIKDKIQQCKSS